MRSYTNGANPGGRNATSQKRYKSFWSKELDGMAKKRKEEYRIAKDLNAVDAWSKYKDIHNKIRKIVRKREEEQYKRFVEEVEEKDAGAAISQLAKMKNLRKSRNFKKQSKVERR